MPSYAARVVALWRAHADAWEALRPRIARETGLRVWNPQRYGLPVYERFARHCLPSGPGALLMFGLNPGKYGMTQTGLPFTDVTRARAALPSLGFDLDAPGLAPPEMRPLLGPYKVERSSASVYGLLEGLWGDAEEGWRHVWAVSPCGLLFLEDDGTNVTPADARLRRDDVRELRLRVVREALALARPRGVILLGQDVARVAREAVEGHETLVVDHPVARGPGRRGPAWWAGTVGEQLRSKGWA